MDISKNYKFTPSNSPFLLGIMGMEYLRVTDEQRSSKEEKLKRIISINYLLKIMKNEIVKTQEYFINEKEFLSYTFAGNIRKNSSIYKAHKKRFKKITHKIHKQANELIRKTRSNTVENYRFKNLSSYQIE